MVKIVFISFCKRYDSKPSSYDANQSGLDCKNGLK